MDLLPFKKQFLYTKAKNYLKIFLKQQKEFGISIYKKDSPIIK